MEKIDLKHLKQLTMLCRKLGIEHLKHGDLELNLTSILPTQSTRKSSKKKTNTEETPSLSQDIESEALTQDALLFYSVRDDVGAESEQETVI